MFLVANILGSSIQISTLPLPVLSTLQAAGLVFNSICATIILHEPFTRWSFYGTALVTGGAVLIAIFGAIPSPAHDLAELLVLMARRPFIIWMILQALFVVAIAVVMDVVNAVSNLSHNSRFRLVRGIVYGVISGILSAHALLFAKSAVELLIKTASGKNQFTRWQSWMILLALVALALCQLYYLHRGLKLVSTSVLYPLVFCVYNIIAILDGLIYFDQTGLISPLRACLITLGTVILLSGVLALSWRLSEEQHAPAVGQSSLAPGLGLVEDTDGEEESLLGSESAVEDDGAGSTYQTFAPINGESTPLTPTRKKTFRWAERAEIWGELEDQDEPTTPVGRMRSSTLPGRTESSPLITRRSVSGAAISSESGPSAESTPRKFGRRRRKSTGFPGLVARRNSRQRGGSVSSVSESIGNLLHFRWWRDKGKRNSVSSAGPSSPLAYRDDPTEEEDQHNQAAGRRPNDSAV